MSYSALRAFLNTPFLMDEKIIRKMFKSKPLSKLSKEDNIIK